MSAVKGTVSSLMPFIIQTEHFRIQKCMMHFKMYNVDVFFL